MLNFQLNESGGATSNNFVRRAQIRLNRLSIFRVICQSCKCSGTCQVIQDSISILLNWRETTLEYFMEYFEHRNRFRMTQPTQCLNSNRVIDGAEALPALGRQRGEEAVPARALVRWERLPAPVKGF
jgi:hypothetical protein